MFRRKRTLPPDHPAFNNLPVTFVPTRDGRTRMAVHRRGRFGGGLMPLVCVAGYQRNMSDFSALADSLGRMAGGGRPVVLVDLPGRGRADDRSAVSDYGSLADARDLADVLAAHGVGRAVFLGQGYGGQVVMALSAAHPLLVGGSILVDAGPVSDSRGIVRMRNNLAHLATLRGKSVQAGFRRMLAGDYPGMDGAALDAIALRTHCIDRRGRAQSLFDARLIEQLKDFSFDDVLVAQWPLYDALTCAPLMLLRTQLTDQLRRETFDEMVRRRPDALALTIEGQGSPALFDQREEIAAIADFVQRCGETKAGRAA